MTRTPAGYRYSGLMLPREVMLRTHSIRARYEDRYRGLRGTPLAVASLATALIESRINQPSTWRSRVRDDARLTRAYDTERWILSLTAPIALHDRLDEIVAERPERWCRVGVVTALLEAALDRWEADEVAARHGDTRAARRIERVLASARPDVRYLTVAQRAEMG